MIPALTGLLTIAKLVPKAVQALKSVLAAAPAAAEVSSPKPDACIKVTFDDLWRPTSTTNALDTFNMAYLGKTGQVTAVNSTAGPSMAYAYGTNAQDRRLTQIKNLGRTGTSLSQFDYTYDAVGQITQLTETIGTATNSTGGGGDDDCHDKCCHKGKCCKKNKCCKKKCCKGKGDCGKERCHNRHDRDDDDDDRWGMAAPFDLRLLNGLLGLGIASLWGGLLWQFARRPRTTTSRLAQVTSMALISALALNGCIFSGGGGTTGGTATNVYNFTYDKLGQLVGVNLNQTPTESYTFDPSGNLTSLTVGNTTTSFAANSLNQQTAPGTHVYDAKGQKTALDGKTFEWDDQGRITAVVVGTQRSEFAYDGMSRRTKITEYTNGTMTSKKLYFWLGGSIVAERDGMVTGFPLLKRYFQQGEVRGTTKLYYCTDHLGSIREMVDSAGTVQAEYRYSTYGEQTKTSGNLDCDWGWSSLWNHKASGLYLGTFRAYDPVNKRWISRDPLGEGVDYNVYRYCGNSPIGFTDPEGLEPGGGGTWGQNSILSTQGAGERASPGHVYTGAENEASFWGQLLMWWLMPEFEGAEAASAAKKIPKRALTAADLAMPEGMLVIGTIQSTQKGSLWVRITLLEGPELGANLLKMMTKLKEVAKCKGLKRVVIDADIVYSKLDKITRLRWAKYIQEIPDGIRITLPL